MSKEENYEYINKKRSERYISDCGICFVETVSKETGKNWKKKKGSKEVLNTKKERQM